MAELFRNDHHGKARLTMSRQIDLPRSCARGYINPLGKWVERIGFGMPDWIARANIEHFKKLFEAETDPDNRRVIERELAEEAQKLAALKRRSERTAG